MQKNITQHAVDPQFPQCFFMTIKKEEKMTTPDKEARRINVRTTFKKCGLDFVAQYERADKFQTGTGQPLYFYWTQSKELNLSIDPRIDCSTLLTLDGVSIPKRLLPTGGLRAGTAVKEFPKTFETVIPKDLKSRVGRMFAVQEAALPLFLRAYVSLLALTESPSYIRNLSGASNTVVRTTLDEEPQLSTNIFELDTVESTSQGYETDPVLRRAIEQYAVAWASNFYSKNGYKVTELGKPFDLLCVRSDEVIHVEVKGSRSMLSSVILTANEVKDARVKSWRSDLFIVEGICIDLSSDAKPKAHAGNARVLHNWEPKAADLSPSRFLYSLPLLSEWVPILFES